MDRHVTSELMARLTRDAARIAARFGLRYRVLEPERPSVRRRYGVCYADGTIRIRLRHAATGHPLKYSSLVNTLCHELAHLRHFNHGARFRSFYRVLLEYARKEGIYRPAPRGMGGRPAPVSPQPASDPSPLRASRPRRTPPSSRPAPGPRQLDLFG